MINPWFFAQNLCKSWQVCPTWPDRWSRMRWLYSDKFPPRLQARRRRIHFRYAPPIGDLSVLVRDNHGSDAFIFGEVFDHRYYDLPLPFQPRTILDLGSNAGFTVLYFARVYPQARIACVEPIADNLALLRENLAANHVSAEVFAAAVAVDDGRLTMTTDAHDYGHKVSGIAYGPQVVGQTVDVEALSIPTLMKRLGWDRIDLLKIDIEGYEGVLLKEKCDWLSGVDAMCIECHEGYGEKDLRALAETYGFQPPRLLPGTWLLVRNGL
jgi:FkbM family methyltransferase